MNLTQIMCNIVVLISQKTHCMSVTKIICLVMYKETIAVYCENQVKI